MIQKVWMLEDELDRVPQVDSDSPNSDFGVGVFDRWRVEHLHDGEFALVGGRQHLDRTADAARRLVYRDMPAGDLIEIMRQRIVTLVEVGLARLGTTNLYGQTKICHAEPGMGQMRMDGTQVPPRMDLWLTQEGPLYGEGAYLLSDREERPWDSRTSMHKVCGNYFANLTRVLDIRRLFKQRYAGLAKAIPESRVTVVLYDKGHRISEGSSCNLVAFDVEEKVLHVSGGRRFPGITEQIVIDLAEQVMGYRIKRDLSQHHLRHGSLTVGTAAGVTPVSWFDGEDVIKSKAAVDLARHYQNLCRGTLKDRTLVERWMMRLDVRC